LRRHARKRRLKDEEYAALGAALGKATDDGSIWPPAISLTRFLLLTGWRRGEGIGLQVPLSKAAIDILRGLTPSGRLVFPATRGNGDVIMSGFKKLWKRLARLGELPTDVTPHVLRHSFASLAADLGYSEPVIAALVGHQGRSITSRYLHSADAVLLAAADAVADRTLELMGERKLKTRVLQLKRPAQR
jgi:hypothetical protein